MNDPASVEAYANSLLSRFPRVHVLINNAAQTITRGCDWLAAMAEEEKRSSLSLPPLALRLLDTPWNKSSTHSCAAFCRIKLLEDQEAAVAASGASGGGRGLQGVAGGEESHHITTAFPLPLAANTTQKKSNTLLDESGQPLDTTRENSWSRTLSQVSTAELLSTMAVNTIAPFLLCARLKEGLAPTLEDPRLGHIVNVNSLEGKFNVGKKSPKHPHTNAAKAALNMLTLTSAREYSRDGILMNSVDTGWITDMAPCGAGASTKAHESFIGPPLDEVDGASRVVDPIFCHVNSGGLERMVGLFLKDYMSASW